MSRPYFVFVAMVITALAFSCSNPEEKKQISEGETAYNEFRSFVVATEDNAESTEPIEIKDTAASIEEINNLKTRFDSYNIRVAEYDEQFTAPQREELLELRERFKIAVDKKQKKNEEASHRYKMRRKLLGIEVSSDDLSEITPNNIKFTYQTFLNTVSEDMDTYSESDWQLVEGFWSALNNRMRQLEDQVEPADEKAIALVQEKYRALNSLRAEAPTQP